MKESGCITINSVVMWVHSMSFVWLPGSTTPCLMLHTVLNSAKYAFVSMKEEIRVIEFFPDLRNSQL